MEAFSLSTGDGTESSPIPSRVDEECTNDYLSIPESSSICEASCSNDSPKRSKYCGGVLNDGTMLTENIPICVCSQPFMISIVTDNADDLGVMAGANTGISKGICLDYEQLPCDS